MTDMARDIREGPHNRIELAEEQIPEFLVLAREAINEWGAGGKYLPQAVAEALERVYELGLSRSPIPAPPPPQPTVLRRTRTQPAAAPATQRVRRTRPAN